MKKVILALLFVFGATQLAKAQIDFGIKGGVNYNADSFNKKSILAVYDDISVDYSSGDFDTSSKTGFHVGIWTRVKLPLVDFYIRPELVYTALKSELTVSGETLADYDFKKIDIPVLFGKKFLKVVHVFAGPSFQYLIDGEFDFKDVANISSTEVNLDTVKTEADGLTVGVQLGAGLELGKFGIDVRWERGFSDLESNLIGDNNTEFEYDTRINQIVVGLSLKF